MIKKIITNIAIVVSSLIISRFWWRSWIYEGAWGGPDILGKIIDADGEGAYDLKQLELFIYVLVICYVLNYCLKRILRRHSTNHT